MTAESAPITEQHIAEYAELAKRMDCDYLAPATQHIADLKLTAPAMRRLIAEVRSLRAFRESVAGMLCVPGASEEAIFRTLKPINDYRSKNWKRCKRYAAPPAMPKRID